MSEFNEKQQSIALLYNLCYPPNKIDKQWLRLKIYSEIFFKNEFIKIHQNYTISSPYKIEVTREKLVFQILL